MVMIATPMPAMKRYSSSPSGVVWNAIITDAAE
jgi:hypothetical protein